MSTAACCKLPKKCGENAMTLKGLGIQGEGLADTSAKLPGSRSIKE